MNDGRRAFKQGYYRDAVDAFSRAVSARPTDPTARGELGYAHLHADQLEWADEQLRVGAQLAARNPALAAQIWFNRGLVAEKRSRAELARACFALSDRLHSTPATQQRLKGKSKCPVAVERIAPATIPDAAANDDMLNVVTGWRAVHAQIVPFIEGGEEGLREQKAPPPATDEEAKRRVCRSYWLSGAYPGNPCDGKPPWRIQRGDMHFRSFFTEVTPLSRDRFALVFLAAGGGGPASGTAAGRTKLAGDRLLVMTTNGEAHFVTRESDCVTELDPTLADAGGIGYGDVQSLTTNEFTVYDTESRRPLVTGVFWGDDKADAIELTSTELRFKDQDDAGTCAVAVPLR